MDLPGIEKILKNFLLMYLDKYGKYREGLMFFLLESYVAKANGNQNP